MHFFDQPEIFSTINNIPAILFHGVSLTEALGCAMVFIICLLIVLRKKIPLIRDNFNGIALTVAAVFWAPLYVIAFFNNVYDFRENLYGYRQFNNSVRSVKRICGVDNYDGLDGVYCHILSYAIFAKNNLPEHSMVKTIAFPGTESYLLYYLYPYFNFVEDVEQAQYLLVYFSPEYYYSGGKLYHRNLDSENKTILGEQAIGEYVMEKEFGPDKYILKALNN